MKVVVTMKSPINIVAAFGLALGGVFGMAGTFVAQPHLQALLWAIDGAGLVVAAAVLALKYSKTEHDLVAAGFIVFAIAEAVMRSGTAGGPVASVPSFGAGGLVGDGAPCSSSFELRLEFIEDFCLPAALLECA